MSLPPIPPNSKFFKELDYGMDPDTGKDWKVWVFVRPNSFESLEHPGGWRPIIAAVAIEEWDILDEADGWKYTQAWRAWRDK